jgi:HPt (histidine-containing phosphotransfer) domain-containing protein
MQSVLDVDVLDELVDIMGDDMAMLLDSYFADSHNKLLELAEMDWQTDQETIFRLAHALKGSSRNVGVIGFSDMCENIEVLARANNLAENDFDLKKLTQLFDIASTELKNRYL